MSEASPTDLYLRFNQAIWKRLPRSLRDTRLLRWHGARLHDMVCGRTMRRQYFGTFFLRNRPELELIRRLLDLKAPGSKVRIANLGCSIGAEIYSLLWIIRAARPDLKLHVTALDYSPLVLEIAKQAVYTDDTSGLVGSSIFERLTEDERHAIFDWVGTAGTVKPWIREGIRWLQGDAGDPGLLDILGPQDIVMASNFLCHMPPAVAEACLRNIARLVDPGGYLFVLGVDLEVRTEIAYELGWEPVPDMLREIHDGDPSVRKDWPWEWWGLEPLDDRRPDWQLRYAVAYRTAAGH